MKDETYVFISDVKTKGSVARSARKRKTHAGKGGRVRLPSDNLSKKELKKMSGECKSYRLNSPMKWNEFKAMPDDIKVTYIKLLREKFSCPDSKIGEMMGASKDQVSLMFKKLGLNQGKTKKKVNWNKEAFYAWANGVDMLPTPVPMEEPIAEPEAYAEEDLPFDIVPIAEPDPVKEEQNLEINFLKVQVDELRKVNEALMKNHETDCQVIEKLRYMCSDYEEKAKILEAKMEVVQLIFGRS